MSSYQEYMTMNERWRVKSLLAAIKAAKRGIERYEGLSQSYGKMHPEFQAEIDRVNIHIGQWEKEIEGIHADARRRQGAAGE